MSKALLYASSRVKGRPDKAVLARHKELFISSGSVFLPPGEGGAHYVAEIINLCLERNWGFTFVPVTIDGRVGVKRFANG